MTFVNCDTVTHVEKNNNKIQPTFGALKQTSTILEFRGLDWSDDDFQIKQTIWKTEYLRLLLLNGLGRKTQKNKTNTVPSQTLKLTRIGKTSTEAGIIPI